MTISATDNAVHQNTERTRYYKYYVLVVLLLVGTFSWTDRQLFAILLESVRHDLSLTDLQLGLLGGTAFGLFYVTVSVPIAWLADRIGRRDIVAIAVGLWSLMTALSGAATGFVSLFFCRVGVGIGEAGGAAPSQSMISDLFPARHRAFAMGALYSYIPLGYFLSYAVGGWLSESISWRVAFLAFGLPGLLLALVMRVTVDEPSRPGRRLHSDSPLSEATSISEQVGHLLGLRSLRYVPLAGAAHGLGMSGAAIWLPAYFIRVHHLGSARVGLALAAIMGVGGLVGTLVGGQFVDRLVSKTQDARWYVWACAAFVASAVPLAAAAFVAKSATLALALFVIPTVFNHMILGPVFALVQGLAGATRRAVGAAYYLFLVNLVSVGIGPLLIGWISDMLRAHFHEESLRYSLLFVIPTASTVAAALFLLAARSVQREFRPEELPS